MGKHSGRSASGRSAQSGRSQASSKDAAGEALPSNTESLGFARINVAAGSSNNTKQVYKRGTNFTYPVKQENGEGPGTDSKFARKKGTPGLTGPRQIFQHPPQPQSGVGKFWSPQVRHGGSRDLAGENSMDTARGLNASYSSPSLFGSRSAPPDVKTAGGEEGPLRPRTDRFSSRVAHRAGQVYPQHHVEEHHDLGDLVPPEERSGLGPQAPPMPWRRASSPESQYRPGSRQSPERPGSRQDSRPGSRQAAVRPPPGYTSSRATPGHGPTGPGRERQTPVRGANRARASSAPHTHARARSSSGRPSSPPGPGLLGRNSMGPVLAPTALDRAPEGIPGRLAHWVDLLVSPHPWDFPESTVPAKFEVLTGSPIPVPHFKGGVVPHGFDGDDVPLDFKFTRKLFPSEHPTDRWEVHQLAKAMDVMCSEALAGVEYGPHGPVVEFGLGDGRTMILDLRAEDILHMSAQQLASLKIDQVAERLWACYDVAWVELSRQAWAHCSDRGILMDGLRAGGNSILAAACAVAGRAAELSRVAMRERGVLISERDTWRAKARYYHREAFEAGCDVDEELGELGGPGGEWELGELFSSDEDEEYDEDGNPTTPGPSGVNSSFGENGSEISAAAGGRRRRMASRGNSGAMRPGALAGGGGAPAGGGMARMASRRGSINRRGDGDQTAEILTLKAQLEMARDHTREARAENVEHKDRIALLETRTSKLSMEVVELQEINRNSRSELLARDERIAELEATVDAQASHGKPKDLQKMFRRMDSKVLALRSELAMAHGESGEDETKELREYRDARASVVPAEKLNQSPDLIGLKTTQVSMAPITEEDREHEARRKERMGRKSGGVSTRKLKGGGEGRGSDPGSQLDSVGGWGPSGRDSDGVDAWGGRPASPGKPPPSREGSQGKGAKGKKKAPEKGMDGGGGLSAGGKKAPPTVIPMRMRVDNGSGWLELAKVGHWRMSHDDRDRGVELVVLEGKDPRRARMQESFLVDTVDDINDLAATIKTSGHNGVVAIEIPLPVPRIKGDLLGKTALDNIKFASSLGKLGCTMLPAVIQASELAEREVEEGAEEGFGSYFICGQFTEGHQLAPVLEGIVRAGEGDVVSGHLAQNQETGVYGVSRLSGKPMPVVLPVDDLFANHPPNKAADDREVLHTLVLENHQKLRRVHQYYCCSGVVGATSGQHSPFFLGLRHLEVIIKDLKIKIPQTTVEKIFVHVKRRCELIRDPGAPGSSSPLRRSSDHADLLTSSGGEDIATVHMVVEAAGFLMRQILEGDDAADHDKRGKRESGGEDVPSMGRLMSNAKASFDLAPEGAEGDSSPPKSRDTSPEPHVRGALPGLTLGGFIEVLVRIGIVLQHEERRKSRAVKVGSKIPLSVATAFTEMVYEKVYKRCTKLQPNARFQRVFNDGAVQAVFNKNKAMFRNMHSWISTGVGGVDYSRWLGFCKRVGALGHRVSVSKAMLLFVEVVDAIQNGSWGVEDDLDLASQYPDSAPVPQGQAQVKVDKDVIALNFEGFLRVFAYISLEYNGVSQLDPLELARTVDAFLDRRVFPSLDSVRQMASQQR